MRHALLLIIILVFSACTTAAAYDFTPGASLSLSGEYNDNVFLAKTAKKSDFITYVTPSAYFSLGSGNAQLSGNYSPSFSYYSSHSDLNKLSHSADVQGLLSLSDKTSVTLNDAFVLSNEPQSLSAFQDLGPIRNKVERRVNNLSSSISCKIRDNLVYLLGGSYLDTDFKGAGMNDAKTYSGNMSVTYMSSERSSFSITARYTKYNYTITNDAQSQDYTLGATHKLTPTLSVGITGGVSNTKVENTGKQTSGFSGGADVSKGFEKGNATLSFRQSVVPGLEDGVPLRSQVISLSLSRNITNLLNASALASYTKYKSSGTAANDSDEARLGANMLYNINSWAGLSLSYNFVDFKDKVDSARDYKNNIVMLSLRLNYRISQGK